MAESLLSNALNSASMGLEGAALMPHADVPTYGGAPMGASKAAPMGASKAAPEIKFEPPKMEAEVYNTPEFDDYHKAYNDLVDYVAETGVSPDAVPSDPRLLPAFKKVQELKGNFLAKAVQLKEIKEATEKGLGFAAAGQILPFSGTTTYAGLSNAAYVHPLDDASTKWNALDNKYSNQEELNAATERKNSLIAAAKSEIERMVSNGMVSPDAAEDYFNSYVSSLEEPMYVPPKPDYEGARLAEDIRHNIAMENKESNGERTVTQYTNDWYNDLYNPAGAPAKAAANYLSGGTFLGKVNAIPDSGGSPEPANGMTIVNSNMEWGDIKNVNDRKVHLVLSKDVTDDNGTHTAYYHLTIPLYTKQGGSYVPNPALSPQNIAYQYLSAVDTKGGVHYSQIGNKLGSTNKQESSKQIIVEKDGQKYYLPESQKDDAISQGYKVVSQ